MKVLLSVPQDISTCPMSDYSADALRQMGCSVTVHNHGRAGVADRLVRHVSRRAFARMKSEELLKLAAHEKPDLVLTIYGKTLSVPVVEELRRMRTRTACWWLDDPFAFDSGEHDLAVAAAFDAYFTNCRGLLDEYRRRGVTRVHYLPVGISPTIHRHSPAPAEYDVLFAGDWHPLRQRVMEDLCLSFRVSIMGPWKKRHMGPGSPLHPLIIKRGVFSGEEMAAAFNRTRIVLNLHTWYGRWNYGVNPRVFEASGCGAFQICDFKEEIPDLYEPGREIVLYKNLEELPDLIAFYLGKDTERRAIGDNALRRTLRDHTYLQRMKELLCISGLKL